MTPDATGVQRLAHAAGEDLDKRRAPKGKREHGKSHSDHQHWIQPEPYIGLEKIQRQHYKRRQGNAGHNAEAARSHTPPCAACSSTRRAVTSATSPSVRIDLKSSALTFMPVAC